MLRSCLVVALFFLALSFLGCETGSESPAPGANDAGAVKIAVIPKGTSHSFWKSVQAGVQNAEAELGITAIWKGPLKEDDRAEQIKVVQQFVSEGVNGIVLAPLDDTALLRPVQSAVDRNIPVVIFDSGLKGDVGKDFISFVATDNRQAGRMGGEELARLLGGKGKVVLLRYQEGSASTHEREEGFLEVMASTPGIEVIVKDAYSGASSDTAQTKALALVDRLRECDGIFCPNESSTQGMLGALRKADLAGKKKFVGFDASGPLVEGLTKGEIDALVSQNPVKMGYEGVKTMVAHIRGETVPPRVDTGVKLITRDNLQDPEVVQLIGEQ